MPSTNPEFHKQRRLKIIEVAEKFFKENRPAFEAERLSDFSRGSIGIVRNILQFGTPEEIAEVKTGEKELKQSWLKIRARLSPEDLKSSHARNSASRSEASLLRKKSEAEIWNKISKAIDALCEMPTMGEVAKIAKENKSRREKLNQKLKTATTALKDLSDVWFSKQS